VSARKRLPGFNGHYIDEEGVVTKQRGDVVEPWIYGRGHLWIRIDEGDTYYRGPVWELMLWTFFRGNYQGVKVEFLDGNRSNPALENLQLVAHNHWKGRECPLTISPAGNRLWTFDKRRFEKTP
jgi:hypothetical protein